MLSATVGLTYRFPARGFRRPMPQLISQVELAAMQAQLAEMGAANQQLQNALVAAQNQPVAEVTETEVIVPDPDIAPRTVFFKIGSAEVSPREAMNLSYLADQMKQFPNATYTVNGYADSATGTPAFNKRVEFEACTSRSRCIGKTIWHSCRPPESGCRWWCRQVRTTDSEPCGIGKISQLGDEIQEIGYKLLAIKDEGYALP